MKKLLATALSATMLLSGVNVFAEYKVGETVLFSETFDEFSSNDNNTGATVGGWRHETSWNEDAHNDGRIDVKSENGFNSALTLTGNGSIGFRGGILLENTVDAGEAYGVELDLYATKNAAFQLSHYDSELTQACEHRSPSDFYFTIRGNGGDETKSCINYPQYESPWYNDETKYRYKDADGEPLQFVHGEINHIKVDYKKDGNKNTLTLTITNSLGTVKSVPTTIKNNLGDGSPCRLDKGLAGLAYSDEAKSATVCMDNIKVITESDASIPELVEENYVSFSNGSQDYTELTDVPVSTTSMTLTFDSSIKTVNDGAVSVTYGKSAKSVPVTTSVNDKTVKVSFDNLLPNMEYSVSVDSSKIIGASGNAMKADADFTFKTGEESSGDVTENGYVYNYYMQEDFSDFEWMPTDHTMANDGIAHWRIESCNNENIKDYVKIEDVEDEFGNKIENALHYMPLTNSNFSNKQIRSAKGFGSSIGPGETFIVEADFMVGDDTDFGIGLVHESATEIENSVCNLLFRTCIGTGYDSEALFRPITQNAWINSASSYSDIVLKRNEINHIKAEVTLNEDMTSNTTDKITVTLTNSMGTKTASIDAPLRGDAANGDRLVDGVKGIKLCTYAGGSDVYCGNIKVYSKYEDLTPKVLYTEFVHEDDETEKDVPSIKPDVKKIKVQFNTAMKYAAEYFDLKDSNGNRVSYTTGYESGNQVVSITLNDMLKENESYTLTVDKAAMSKAGATMENDYTHKFTTSSLGDIILSDITVSDSVDANTDTATVGASTTLVKTNAGKQQYALYLMAFDANKRLLGVEYQPITYEAEEYGTKDITKSLTIANQSNAASVKAVLVSYPDFQVIKVETIR